MRVRRSKTLRWIEYLFLICGLASVDYYIWVNVESTVSQAYQNWKFDRALKKEQTAPPRQQGEPPHEIALDAVVGRIEIPRLNVRAIVREGDDAAILRHAVGHIPSSAFPGELGNVALAAHRDTFFRALRNIRKNDRILVSTLNGDYEYVVQSTKIVAPTDVGVLKASAEHELTLVTCYPFYYVGSAPQRFIVHATQVASTRPLPQQQIGS